MEGTALGEYFKLVNPAKAQCLDNPLSDNKWHNILGRSSNTVCILNHLICKTGLDHPLCGSWSGDAVYIVGDEANPDEFGIATATREDTGRNLYDKAEREYESLAGRGAAMLEEHPSDCDNAFLIANLTRKQFIDPLCFSEFSPLDDPLGGAHGQTIAYLYCRASRFEGHPFFGSWSKDALELVREGTPSFDQALQTFENVGHIAIELLQYFLSEEEFRLLARVNPRFIKQLRLSKLKDDWTHESDRAPNEQKGLVAQQIITVAEDWSAAQTTSQALAQVMNERMSDLLSQFQGMSGTEKFIEGIKDSITKQNETLSAHTAKTILKKAFERAQSIYESETPCGIVFSDLESTFDDRDKERQSANDARPYLKQDSVQ